MSARGSKIRNLAATLAVFGILALVGTLDNQWTIRHNLETGYDTSALITGANEQHRWPLTFDGLRPRLVDQTYSLDLAWHGRDGSEHTRQKVPVSDEFMASLMAGNKVRLVPVPIKVTDEQGAVPTIVPDATARLDHLDSFGTIAGYGAGLAALVFVVIFGIRWQRRWSDGSAESSAPESIAWHIPPRLAMLTALCLGTAGAMGYYSLKDSWGAEAIRAHGRDATATISGIHASMGSDHTTSYTVDLTWRDGAGLERHYGPTHISSEYAQRIAANGVLFTRQTAIRYLEEDPSARPIIVPDAAERTMQDRVGQIMIPVFGIAGILLAAVTVWQTRRRHQAALA